MNDFRPLGPPIRPEPPVAGDKLERVRKGVWKLNGKFQTVIPDNERANLPTRPAAPIPAEPVESAPAVDYILAAMERLKDPRFPAVFWGTW
jgi:hypothetical protein